MTHSVTLESVVFQAEDPGDVAHTDQKGVQVDRLFPVVRLRWEHSGDGCCTEILVAPCVSEWLFTRLLKFISLQSSSPETRENP